MPESVMIVEDEGLVALELEECLRQMGYRVPSVVASGPEAIVRAAEIRPDLILMDIRLKGEMDGIEAARRIMSEQAIPVVYLTAHSDDATVRRARETAPFGYVLKPWEEKSLQIAIDLALHKARTEAGIKNERDWYLSILRYTGAPMLVCGTDGTVRFLNAAAEQLLGGGARGAVGRPLEQVVDLHEQSGAPSLSASLLRSGQGDSGDQSFFLGDGVTGLPVDVTTVPIMGEGGDDLGFLVVMRPQKTGRLATRVRKRRARPMSLDEYLQTELIRLLILQEQGGEQVDRFVEGELEAYRRLMRDFLGRNLLEFGRIDWRQGLVRRAVRDAHEQTKAVLSGRPDILEGGRLTPARFARYLEILCDRLVAPNGKPPPTGGTHVEMEAVDLELDTAIYCVLIVNEVLQDALPNGVPRPVSIALGAGETGFGKLVLSLRASPGETAQPVTPVLEALVSELNGSLSVDRGAQTTWTITFPLAAKQAT